MTLFGYARASIRNNMIAEQISKIKNTGVSDLCIFTDITSDNKDKFYGLNKLLSVVVKGDVIICTKMDRLGSNTSDMISIVSDCYENGVCFRFLENNVSTEGDCGVGVVNILIAVYHAERDRFIEKEKEASVYINKTQRKHSMKVNQAIELIIKNKWS